ncbi:ABC transporter permease, partial [bacterium]
MTSDAGMTPLAEERRMGRGTRTALMVATAPELVTFVLLLIAFAVGASMSPYFADAGYLLNSTSLYMETGLMALAMTFVIVSGNIDLSVASNLALTACIVATLHDRGAPMWLAATLGPVIGATLGLFNGLLITRLRLPSLTVTLGTLALYRGLAQVLAGDRSI